jgi:hypothetical protein
VVASTRGRRRSGPGVAPRGTPEHQHARGCPGRVSGAPSPAKRVAGNADASRTALGAAAGEYETRPTARRY